MVNWLMIFMTCVFLLVVSTGTGFLIDYVQSFCLLALCFFMALAFLPEEDSEKLEGWYLNFLLNPMRKVIGLEPWEDDHGQDV